MNWESLGIQAPREISQHTHCDRPTFISIGKGQIILTEARLPQTSGVHLPPKQHYGF